MIGEVVQVCLFLFSIKTTKGLKKNSYVIRFLRVFHTQ